MQITLYLMKTENNMYELEKQQPLPFWSLRLYWDHSFATLWLKSTCIRRSSIKALSIYHETKKESKVKYKKSIENYSTRKGERGNKYKYFAT